MNIFLTFLVFVSISPLYSQNPSSSAPESTSVSPIKEDRMTVLWSKLSPDFALVKGGSSAAEVARLLNLMSPQEFEDFMQEFQINPGKLMSFPTNIKSWNFAEREFMCSIFGFESSNARELRLAKEAEKGPKLTGQAAISAYKLRDRCGYSTDIVDAACRHSNLSQYGWECIPASKGMVCPAKCGCK